MQSYCNAFLTDLPSTLSSICQIQETIIARLARQNALMKDLLESLAARTHDIYCAINYDSDCDCTNAKIRQTLLYVNDAALEGK